MTRRVPSFEDKRPPAWISTLLLLVWLAAAVVVFLPFAANTSPLDAILLQVPGNQGNWWHALAAAPFFLAFPMIWLRLRALSSRPLSTAVGRRAIWIVVGLCACGLISVEAPFLLHLAGTSEWQRLTVLSLGFGMVIATATLLFFRRRHIFPTSACLAGLNAAYLANASLVLIVYSEPVLNGGSRSGWYVTLAIVWPMILELAWIFYTAVWCVRSASAFPSP